MHTKRVQKQSSTHDPAHAQRIAWIALLMTAIVLLTPGAVIETLQSLVQPALEALRSWKNGWWPWPVSEVTDSSLAVDKIVHALLFAICAALASRAWEATLSTTAIFLLLLLFAALTELAQYFIPGRGMSPGDMVADTLGAVLGLGFRYWVRIRQGTTGRRPS